MSKVREAKSEKGNGRATSELTLLFVPQTNKKSKFQVESLCNNWVGRDKRLRRINKFKGNDNLGLRTQLLVERFGNSDWCRRWRTWRDAKWNKKINGKLLLDSNRPVAIRSFANVSLYFCWLWNKFQYFRWDIPANMSVVYRSKYLHFNSFLGKMFFFF